MGRKASEPDLYLYFIQRCLFKAYLHLLANVHWKCYLILLK